MSDVHKTLRQVLECLVYCLMRADKVTKIKLWTCARKNAALCGESSVSTSVALTHAV